MLPFQTINWLEKNKIRLWTKLMKKYCSVLIVKTRLRNKISITYVILDNNQIIKKEYEEW